MKNQCVALLLLACLVTAHGWKWEDIGMRGKRKTPQQCFEYCYAASVFPHVIKEPYCRTGCKYIPMWEISAMVRKHGPVGSPASSPGQAPKIDHMRPKMENLASSPRQAPKIDHMRPKMENLASSPRQAPKIDHMQPKMETLTISPRQAPKVDDIRSKMENLRK